MVIGWIAGPGRWLGGVVAGSERVRGLISGVGSGLTVGAQGLGRPIGDPVGDLPVRVGEPDRHACAIGGHAT